MFYPLVTERLSIRPLAMTELESFVEYRRDPAIARFQGWESTYSTNDAIDLIESQVGVDIPAEGQWLQLAIHELKSGVHVGDLALHTVSVAESVFELGFTIASNYQRRGYATEAAAALLQSVSSTNSVTKFIANTDRRNLSSINALVALGFRPDTTRSFTEEFKGETVDVDFYEKLVP